MQRLEWHGESWHLLPEKAIFWEAKRTVLITDPHFGKESSFQQAGIAVPLGSTAADLDRLERILRQTQAERLIVLGDFFHNEHSISKEILKSLSHWREKHVCLECILIRGNHDRFGDPPESLQIRSVCEPYLFSGFSFFHHPPQNRGEPSFAGHIHPSVRLKDSIGLRLRVPCFLFKEDLCLLPAFGSFTGTFPLQIESQDRVFAVGEEEVVEVKNRPKRE